MTPIAQQKGLRDPIWQGLGVVIATISVLIASLISYDIYFKSQQFSDLSIIKTGYFNPIFTGNESYDKISLLIDGIPVKYVRVFSFYVHNTGKTPIKPADYIEPIQISLDEPYNLLFVESGYEQPNEINTVWTKVTTNTFRLEPILLNPDDSFQVLMFINNPTDKKPDDSSDTVEPKLEGRIINIPAVKFSENKEDNSVINSALLGVSVRLYGWAIYTTVAISAIFFATLLSASTQTKRVGILRNFKY